MTLFFTDFWQLQVHLLKPSEATTLSCSCGDTEARTDPQSQWETMGVEPEFP